MSSSGHKHETKDVDIKKVAYSGLAFFVIGFGALYLLRPLFHRLTRFTHQEELSSAPVLEVRAPRLLDPKTEMKAASGEELQELRAREAEILDSYGWINKELGVVHVPIDRAIERIAKRGMQARPVATSSAAAQDVRREPTPSVPLGESNGFSEGGVP